MLNKLIRKNQESKAKIQEWQVFLKIFNNNKSKEENLAKKKKYIIKVSEKNK